MSGWGCYHEVDGYCERLKRDCDPGIPGCVLYGKVVFVDPKRNPPPERMKRPIESAHKKEAKKRV